MITGNFKTYELTILNGSHAELDLHTVVSTEMLVKINPVADEVRLLITPSSSSAIADAADFRLIDDSENEFELGPGLDRLSFYNGSGGQVKVSIAVLF